MNMEEARKIVGDVAEYGIFSEQVGLNYSKQSILEAVCTILDEQLDDVEAYIEGVLRSTIEEIDVPQLAAQAVHEALQAQGLLKKL